MKIAYSLIILAVFLSDQGYGQGSRPSGENGGVTFERGMNWKQVLAKANREGKYIFMDVFATWCGPCKQMDHEVYPDERTAMALKGRFISIKVQVDTSAQDDGYTRGWYEDAKELSQKYKIVALPCYLFFDPAGKVIYRDLGYMDVKKFTKMVELVQEPKFIKMYDLLGAYEQGTRDYSMMGDLAIFVKRVIGNRKLADSIARDYKAGYLDKLDRGQICNVENFNFISEFAQFISSKDAFFSLCYDHQDMVDSLKGSNGWARFQVESTITREELSSRFGKGGNYKLNGPYWEQARNGISRKYAKVDAKKLVVKFQILYYRTISLNWRNWAKCISQKINDYPPKVSEGADRLSLYFDLNLPAWDAFEHCNEKRVLRAALGWSELSIRLTDPLPDAPFLDTRANLLYKLGHVKAAIAQEQDAIQRSGQIAKQQGKSEANGPDMNLFIDTKNKMLSGLPTWPLN